MLQTPKSSATASAVYFPGLNGIRALAAFLVIVCHIDEWSPRFGVPSLDYYRNEMGAYAVVMFFVLSGFLITYLLMREKDRFGTISFRKFYTRRILRIWPVYYTVLLVGTALVIFFSTQLWHFKSIYATFLFYFFMIPNLAHNLGFRADLIGVLWSIGVEEQFYAVWPFVVKHSKIIIRSLLVLLFMYLAMKYFLITYVHSSVKFNKWLHFMSYDHMAVGAIAAWLYYKKHSLLRVLYHPVTQVICWSFLLVSIVYRPVHIPFLTAFDRNYHAIVYAIIILNVGTNPRTLISLENKICNFLGKLSYGIYAYHFIVLFLLSLALKGSLSYLGNGILERVSLYALGIGATVLVSHLSYRYMESWFLRRKERFMLIRSSNSASRLNIKEEVPESLIPPELLQKNPVVTRSN